MICKKCGFDLGDAKVCLVCSTVVEEVVEQPIQESSFAPENTQQSTYTEPFTPPAPQFEEQQEAEPVMQQVPGYREAVAEPVMQQAPSFETNNDMYVQQSVNPDFNVQQQTPPTFNPEPPVADFNSLYASEVSAAEQVAAPKKKNHTALIIILVILFIIIAAVAVAFTLFRDNFNSLLGIGKEETTAAITTTLPTASPNTTTEAMTESTTSDTTGEETTGTDTTDTSDNTTTTLQYEYDEDLNMYVPVG